MKLVELVPNFSEGKNKEAVDSIASAASSVSGVAVLDVEMDPDHHRSVLTLVCPPEAAVEAAFRAARRASELIDLNLHKGEHPRMGAVDVIPFIPVSEVTMEECVDLAQKLGERIGRELEIPVYLYDQAARRPERKDLASVRKGQFEGLREEIGKNPDRDPDFGPRKIHPTAGAVAVGARQQIINFNLNLSTQDAELGRAISRKVRASSGGLPHVRAKEIVLERKRQIQISTVLTNYQATGIRAVYEAVLKEAQAAGAGVAGTEIVGLVPEKALLDFALQELRLEGFNPEAQVLEKKLSALDRSWEASASSLLEAVSSTAPTPGGGSAAAFTGALACALGQMAVGISIESFHKKKDPQSKADIPGLVLGLGELSCMQAGLKNCMVEDSRAFEKVMAALKLPKEDPQREAAVQQAFKEAASVPLKTASLSLKALRKLKDLEPWTSRTVVSDVKTACYLAKAAVYGAYENVEVNLPSIKDEGYAQETRNSIEEVLRGIAE